MRHVVRRHVTCQQDLGLLVLSRVVSSFCPLLCWHFLQLMSAD